MSSGVQLAQQACAEGLLCAGPLLEWNHVLCPNHVLCSGPIGPAFAGLAGQNFLLVVLVFSWLARGRVSGSAPSQGVLW